MPQGRSREISNGDVTKRLDFECLVADNTDINLEQMRTADGNHDSQQCLCECIGVNSGRSEMENSRAEVRLTERYVHKYNVIATCLPSCFPRVPYFW